jgi:tetratricopeptide (TPR) repeat protein
MTGIDTPPETLAELVAKFAQQKEQAFTPALEQTAHTLYELAYQQDALMWQAEADYAKGVIAFYKSQHEEGLRYYYDAEQKFTLLEEPTGLIRVWIGIGVLYSVLKKFDSALSLYQKAASILEPLGASERLLHLYINITGTATEARNEKLCLDYFERALELADILQRPALKVIVLHNLGYFYMTRKDWDRATEQLELSARLSEIHNLKHNLANVLAQLGLIALEQNRPHNAIDYGLKIIDLQADIGNNKQKLHSWELLAVAYERIHEWEKAAQAHKQYLAVYKEMQGIETTNKINELNIQYESKKKEIEIQQAQLAQAQAELKALRSQMNPHFIYNTINAIQGLIYNNQPFAASDYLSEFSFLMRKVLDMSSQEWISLPEELDFLQLYLSLEKLRFGADFEYDFDMTDIVSQECTLPALFLQPLVENALRHGLLHKSGTKKLALHFAQKNNYLVVRITDNGVGRAASTAINQQQPHKHKSYASSALAQRTSLLNNKEPDTISYEVYDLEEAGEPLGTSVLVSIKQSK